MSLGIWAAFLGASVLLTLMPGPDILFVISQSIAGGRKHGSAIGLGLCTGLLAHIAAAALGVSAAVYSSEAAFQAVKALGAAYLFYLAWRSWISAGSPAEADEEGSAAGSAPGAGGKGKERASSFSSGSGPISFRRLYRRGILMNVMNPKVSLFFVAFLPQFVVPAGSIPVPLQMLLLGLLFLAQALVIFQAVAYAAGRIRRQWIRGAKARHTTARVQAVLYALLGAQLLFMHFI